MIACALRSHRLADLRIVLATAAFAAVAAPAAAQVAYTGSVEGATGDYIFAERTTGVYLLNGVEVAAGRFRFSAVLPLIAQSTPWVAYGPTLIPTGGARSAQVGEQLGRGRGNTGRTGRDDVVVSLPTEAVSYQAGVGDPVIRAGADLLPGTAATQISVGAAVKAPVADPADGLGTGEWDYGATLAVSRLDGPHHLFGAIELWRFGSLPDLSFETAASYQVGYERFVRANRWSVMAAVTGWTTILEGVDPPVSVQVGLTRHLEASGRAVGLTASFGVTEMAPTVSLSLGWRLPL